MYLTRHERIQGAHRRGQGSLRGHAQRSLPILIDRRPVGSYFRRSGIRTNRDIYGLRLRCHWLASVLPDPEITNPTHPQQIPPRRPYECQPRAAKSHNGSNALPPAL